MEDECGGVLAWWPLAGLLLHGGGEGDSPACGSGGLALPDMLNISVVSENGRRVERRSRITKMFTELFTELFKSKSRRGFWSY